MKWLAFEDGAGRPGCRFVRRARFEQRSLLPAAAACMAASGIREALGALLGRRLHAFVLEPACPTREAWTTIARDVRLFSIGGARCPGALLVADADAAALARAAFGEDEGARTATLSSMEEAVFQRMLSALAAACAGLCGPSRGGPVESRLADHEFSTFFEVVLERPAARIGVALAAEPPSEGSGPSAEMDLSGVGLTLGVRLELASIPLSTAASLEPGSFVPMMDPTAARGALSVDGRVLALGECGVKDGRYAFVIS